MPMIEPRRLPIKMVRTADFHPINEPTAALSLMSPPPMPPLLIIDMSSRLPPPTRIPIIDSMSPSERFENP